MTCPPWCNGWSAEGEALRRCHGCEAKRARKAHATRTCRHGYSWCATVSGSARHCNGCLANAARACRRIDPDNRPEVKLF